MSTEWVWRIASPSLSDSTTVLLHPSSPTRTTGRTASAGPVQPAYGGWTVATATSAATSPNSGAATISARSVVGASACSLPWWVGQEGLGGGASLGPAHPHAWEWWAGLVDGWVYSKSS